MQVLGEKILEVSVFGFLPSVLSLLVLGSAILEKVIKKEKISLYKSVTSKRKHCRNESIYEKKEHIIAVFWICGITLGLIPLLMLFNAKYSSYIYRMIEKVETVGNIVVGLTTMAITMAVVIIVFDRKYYIVFSIRDVLQKYLFAEILVILITSCIVVSIMTMTLLDGKIDSYFDVFRFMIFEVATIYNIITAAYILYIITKIMFFEGKDELKLLSQLYRRFWIPRIDTLNFKEKKNWSQEAVEINVQYLIDQYTDVCRHKKIVQISNIEYVTTMDIYKEKWYRKARDKFIRMMYVLLIISSIIDIWICKEYSYWFISLDIIIAVITIAISYLKIETVQSVIMFIFLDDWGYYISLSDKREKFVNDVAVIFYSSYKKYLMRMNSLNAFFHIWIEDIKKDKDEIKFIYLRFIKCLQEVREKNMVIYLPAFTIGYFLYEKNINVDEIKKLYKKFVLDENKQDVFKKMMHSQVFYLTKNFKEDVFEYSKKLSNYIKWMET